MYLYFFDGTAQPAKHRWIEWAESRVLFKSTPVTQ